jgi:hypothetical protein
MSAEKMMLVYEHKTNGMKVCSNATLSPLLTNANNHP